MEVCPILSLRTVTELMQRICCSLPHWVAYWAIGHRAAMVHYKLLIEELFAKMEGIIPELRLENRGSAHDYFAMSWKAIHTLTAGLDDHTPDPNQERFATYVESEEKRVKANLEAVDYIIDGLDTLSLVTGAGRIEKVSLDGGYHCVRRLMMNFLVAVCSSVSAAQASLRDHADSPYEGHRR